MQVIAEGEITEITESFVDETDAIEPLLEPGEYRAAGLTETADKSTLDRKYAGGPEDNLMRAVKQPIRGVRVEVTQGDLELLDDLCERWSMERGQMAQALLRWAISRRKDWEGPAE